MKDIGIEIGIVTGLTNGKHSHDFQVFSVKEAIPEIGTIGVLDETFAISFTPNFSGRFSFALYLDGINSNQGSGIRSINAIQEHLRCEYKSHQGKFIIANENKITGYLDRYSQKNGENRMFQFTSNKNSGINEILVSDPSLNNRIEVYVWKEYVEKYDYDFDELPDFSPRSKIGAGKATNKGFSAAAPLIKPTFLGKATFIHQPAEKLMHMGEPLIPIHIPDPMDRIPRS